MLRDKALLEGFGRDFLLHLRGQVCSYLGLGLAVSITYGKVSVSDVFELLPL